VDTIDINKFRKKKGMAVPLLANKAERGVAVAENMVYVGDCAVKEGFTHQEVTYILAHTLGNMILTAEEIHDSKILENILLIIREVHANDGHLT
jgi:hypothetical protein